MKAHEKIHLDIKPHSCQFCGRGYVFKRDLNRHYRTHIECSGKYFEHNHSSGQKDNSIQNVAMQQQHPCDSIGQESHVPSQEAELHLAVNHIPSMPDGMAQVDTVRAGTGYLQNVQILPANDVVVEYEATEVVFY